MNRETVKLTSKGQLTLPKEYRDRLGLTQGCQLTVALKGDALVMKKFYPVVPLGDQDPIWDMVGLFENSPGKAVAKGKQNTSATAARGNQGASIAVATGNSGVSTVAATGNSSTSAVVVSRSPGTSTTVVAMGKCVTPCSRGEVAACKKC